MVRCPAVAFRSSLCGLWRGHGPGLPRIKKETPPERGSYGLYADQILIVHFVNLDIFHSLFGQYIHINQR